jgi:molybdopterin-containing oxidoreductase family iron-sulfur binding subunit
MSTEKQQPDFGRRAFVGKVTASAAAAVVPGTIMHTIARARALDEAVDDQVRWGMMVDTGKCAEGCDACVQACNDEHGLQGQARPLSDAQWVRKVRLQDRLTGRVTTLPMMCQHCKTAPCVDVCPTGASFRRADGIVLVNMHTCIGCRYCMMACPYKARSFVHEALTDQVPDTPRGKGCVEGCNFCVQRVDASDSPQPACAEACDAAGHRAIVFGNLNDPGSEVAQRARSVPSRQIPDSGVRAER